MWYNIKNELKLLHFAKKRGALMELLQLKYFTESAKTENFSIVAKKYFVPVSSVSASVRKLEKELGCPLFEREANKLRLNGSGRIFFDSINSALSLIESAKEKISPENESLGHINILVKSKKKKINDMLIAFVKENPTFTFHLTQKASALEEKDYDIIVDDRPTAYKNYMQRLLTKERIRIAVSKNNPLCKRKLVLNDLKHCKFVTTCDGNFLNTVTKEICNNAGFCPNIIIESDSLSDLQKYVKEDIGIACLSDNFLTKEETNYICFLNVIDLDYTRITYIYLNENKRISKAAKLFFDYVNEKTELY